MRKNTPPQIGVVASSIGVFSDDGKEVAESKLIAFIETLQREKKIHVKRQRVARGPGICQRRGQIVLCSKDID
jgi:hypothetical protein